MEKTNPHKGVTVRGGRGERGSSEMLYTGDMALSYKATEPRRVMRETTTVNSRMTI